MLRRQSIRSLIHVKDRVSFPWNQIYLLVVIRSKESEIPKFLECMYIAESLKRSKHIEEITKKITVGISALKQLRDFASLDVFVSVYNALIMPHFHNCEAYRTLCLLGDHG